MSGHTNTQLTIAEQTKRAGLTARKPYVAAKLARIAAMEERGEISPIIRLEKSYLCNFHCSHCSAEPFMDRHKKKVFKIQDQRRTIDLDDVRELSRQADELGLARFVITGGEPLVMDDFDAVVAAIDPDKHYVITDTNGWFLDDKKARHLKAIGVEKVQLSLDSFIEGEHDAFRNKPGSYKRVMRAIDASIDAGLNLILSTVLVKGRAKTDEFESLCRFATEKGIGLYVSYAKPTGACTEHPELAIDKEDADRVRELEAQYNVFTHMTPSYGSFKGCITTKGIITVTSTFEVTPCPYIHLSLGNLRETPLKEVLARGMRNPWLGPYRPDCLIGEDARFIALHARKTEGVKLLPVPWGEGFSDSDSVIDGLPSPSATGLFEATGRCRPEGITAPAHENTRDYFKIPQPVLDFDVIHARLGEQFGAAELPDAEAFRRRAEAILARLNNDPRTRNLLNGARVPFMLPRARHTDIGSAIEDRYLPAVRRAFEAARPKSRFVDHHAPGSLAGRLAVAAGTRHERLVDAMSSDSIVGWYFPCLTEYSVPAAHERMAGLPDHFLLAGGYDTCAALAGSPDLLMRSNGYAPLLWFAALESEPGEGHYFEAYGRNLTFNRRMHFNAAAEYWASGLSVLG